MADWLRIHVGQRQRIHGPCRFPPRAVDRGSQSVRFTGEQAGAAGVCICTLILRYARDSDRRYRRRTYQVQRGHDPDGADFGAGISNRRSLGHWRRLAGKTRDAVLRHRLRLHPSRRRRLRAGGCDGAGVAARPLSVRQGECFRGRLDADGFFGRVHPLDRLFRLQCRSGDESLEIDWTGRREHCLGERFRLGSGDERYVAADRQSRAARDDSRPAMHQCGDYFAVRRGRRPSLVSLPVWQPWGQSTCGAGCISTIRSNI